LSKSDLAILGNYYTTYSITVISSFSDWSPDEFSYMVKLASMNWRALISRGIRKAREFLIC
jgi:hypothetical protein